MKEHFKTCRCGAKVAIFLAGVTRCPKCDSVVWVCIATK